MALRFIASQQAIDATINFIKKEKNPQVRLMGVKSLGHRDPQAHFLKFFQNHLSKENHRPIRNKIYGIVTSKYLDIDKDLVVEILNQGIQREQGHKLAETLDENLQEIL